MLEREQAAGAPEARLHLVGAEERPVAAAELLGALEVAVRRQVHALPLDGLDDEERHVLRRELALERLEVADRHLREAGQQRAEPVAELGRGRRGERAEREPVEAVLRREHARAAGRGAAELDRGLDRLRAGAREDHLAERGGRTAQELLGQQRRERVDAELHRARALKLERLDQRLADARVVAAHVEHPEAAEHVEVAVAVRVPEVGALGARPAAVEADRAQQPDELRVDRLRVEVERLGAAFLHQLGEPPHDWIIATRL